MNICEVINSKTSSRRYYSDGKRISREAYDLLIINARMQNRSHDCFVSHPRGHIRRNYSCIGAKQPN